MSDIIKNQLTVKNKITKEKIIKGIRFIIEHLDISQMSQVTFADELKKLGCDFTFEDMFEQFPLVGSQSVFKRIKKGNLSAGAEIIINCLISESGRINVKERLLPDLYEYLDKLVRDDYNKDEITNASKTSEEALKTDDEVLKEFINNPENPWKFEERYNRYEEIRHEIEIIDGKEVHKFYPASLDDIVWWFKKKSDEGQVVYASFLGHILCSSTSKTDNFGMYDSHLFYQEVYGKHMHRRALYEETCCLEPINCTDMLDCVDIINDLIATFKNQEGYCTRNQTSRFLTSKNFEETSYDEIAKQIFGIYNLDLSKIAESTGPKTLKF